MQEIREFRVDNPNWSAIHQIQDGYEIYYSIAGDLALQAVQKAGEYYKLNVPLTAEYMIGKTWADVH